MFPIELNCIYYYNYYTKYDLLGKFPDYSLNSLTTATACSGCPTYERIKNGEAMVGDQCSFCKNNKMKVTCGDTRD